MNLLGAPDSAAQRITEAMKTWIVQLTDCLHIWGKKIGGMTDGELILAKTNLGSLIESWLIFFCSVYYEDYLLEPSKNRRDEIIEPKDMRLEDLKIFCRGKLWEKGDNWDNWVEKMQRHRNAIHSFNFRDIGSSSEFFHDCEIYFQFLEKLTRQLPDSPAFAREYLGPWDT